MIRLRLIVVLLAMAPLFCWALPASTYTVGRQTNAAANTVLADSGTLESPGTIGANYRVALILNGSGGMTFKLEALDSQGVIQFTIYLSAPAAEAKVIDIGTNFFIPNGYSIRVRNETALLLGGTLQATLLMEVKELN